MLVYLILFVGILDFLLIKYLYNYLVKSVIKKTHESNLMHFLDEKVYVFFLEKESLKSKNVNRFLKFVLLVISTYKQIIQKYGKINLNKF